MSLPLSQRHKDTLTRTHSLTHTHTNTRTHSLTHSLTHTHTHTYTHTHTLSLSLTHTLTCKSLLRRGADKVNVITSSSCCSRGIKVASRRGSWCRPGDHSGRLLIEGHLKDIQKVAEGQYHQSGQYLND